uniref:Phenylalanine--tRNA ligase beta subunit, chloroplastic n=1 Tax=Kryptoperidinium foliaceum TaxID=160619 RepID=D7PJL4_9DINO|nr:phenylalanyl-tRNA synthetase beta subunit [Kryptoperidinium foliaceum]ADI40414.1 phenylalanyl-tRNA synthetase beta subunit [Kryptoperidinium foliaceum]
MQISLKWINELINLEKTKLDDLIDKLTLGGFEVEDVLNMKVAKDSITALEVSSTANRSDSLSIQGLSLEMAALLNQTPKKLDYTVKTCSWSDQLQSLPVKSSIKKDCSGFIGLTIENVTNVTSPKWLQQKLLASGLAVENNLTDFQNYLVLETGYPLEFYDLDQLYSKLNSSKIHLSLQNATKTTSFLANNEKEYLLNDLISVVCANEVPISIAGIISSATSHYSDQTKTLLVEASIFNAAKIRQQSRQLGLRTDRSSRYEKSLKNITLLESVYRFVSLLRIANPNLQCKLHTISEFKNESSIKITLDYQRVKQVLGPIKNSTVNEIAYILPNDITNALNRLQFQVTYDSTNLKWEILIPALRNEDIIREIDVIEEIGRIYGFNNFLTRLPNVKTIGKKDIDYQTRQKFTSALLGLGFNELIQYSLIKQESYLNNEINLLNPLGKDYSHLRLSLLPNLLQATEENLKKGNSMLEGFEYGHVFSTNSSSEITETEVLAGIFGGIKPKQNWSESSTQVSWLEGKGKMEQFFKTLNILTYWKPYQLGKEKNIFHIYCTSEIFLSNGQKVGIFGQISPILANQLNLPTETYLFEFQFEILKSQLQQNSLTVYQEYSLYPKIIKDLSFIVKKTISFDKIQELIYFNGSSVLQEIHLLDEYRGESIPKEHTSLCLQLIFQSEAETLQNEKVERVIENLKHVLKQKLNATIRG